MALTNLDLSFLNVVAAIARKKAADAAWLASMRGDVCDEPSAAEQESMGVRPTFDHLFSSAAAADADARRLQTRLKHLDAMIEICLSIKE